MAGDISFKFTVDGAEQSELSLAFQGRLQAEIDKSMAAIQAAYPRAMTRGVVSPGKSKLRATIEATGFYKASSLAKTWRGYTYPQSGSTLEPAGFFVTRAALIVNAFEDGVTITVQHAKYLAIPEGPAKAIIHSLNQASNRSRVGGQFATEADPTERVAKSLGTTLIPLIDKRTERGVLVSSLGQKLTPGGRLAKSQAGRPTPLFALVKKATLKRRPMGREVLAEIRAGFMGDFVSALAAELPPENR